MVYLWVFGCTVIFLEQTSASILCSRCPTRVSRQDGWLIHQHVELSNVIARLSYSHHVPGAGECQWYFSVDRLVVLCSVLARPEDCDVQQAETYLMGFLGYSVWSLDSLGNLYHRCAAISNEVSKTCTTSHTLAVIVYRSL
ncbi:uncharacterized protein B0I36DRAFT_107572 [Microdochium trichocladiopsis]|uniref:Secreted protein n=1 Tax=Microdochium trichocladiopsis TaxID=1682393 RepID=A0A9P9BRZ3_9PEZI|nr:uncharacterized protein B0I36DRAFT_107572 [Microdochium trichocladiopsis]KAH7033325.1 hypothetical protein B0I36DRAFT_107572 [Microdochium trichocladiopsis]